MTKHTKSILILDFGSQYTQLVARRVREFGIYCELQPFDWPAEKIKQFNPAGIILSGGPSSVYHEGSPRAPQIVFELGVPVFGICYGMQTMATQLGGAVEKCDHREFGYAQAQLMTDSALLKGIEDHIGEKGEAYLDVWMSHGDRVCKLPPDFEVIASTPSTPIAGMSDEKRRFYAVLFHPEVTHTKQGERIFYRFVREICDCPLEWTPSKILEDSIKEIQTKIGEGQVILGLSGGVDSTVVAALLHKAIGKQLICVFVDHGLLRNQDLERIDRVLNGHMKLPIIKVDASERFLSALAGVSDPEQKRKIIGKIFIDVFEEEAARHPNAQWLAQGTIYSDVIESAATESGKAHSIKSHHNVGGLPEKMNLKLLEPLRELFKDEVRKLGLQLGLPSELVYQHPFPGPGLAVRVLGEVKPEYLSLLRKADEIFLEELQKQGYYAQVKQAFAVFLPVKSVGVIGDARQYAYVIALRAIETSDFMTARWAHLPYELLETVSNRIINESHGISRVVYDISGKPPATIEWE